MSTAPTPTTRPSSLRRWRWVWLAMALGAAVLWGLLLQWIVRWGMAREYDVLGLVALGDLAALEDVARFCPERLEQWAKGLRPGRGGFYQYDEEPGAALLLDIATGDGRYDVMRFFLKRGVSTTALLPYRGFALQIAAARGDCTGIQLLLDYGADIHHWTEVGGALHEAARRGHVVAAAYLVQHGAAVNSVEKWGRTSLHVAAFRGQPGMIRFLLDRGADLNRRTYMGETALHCAALGGHAATVEFLLDHAADPNTLDNYGGTPLHGAARLDRVEAIRVLAARGAVVHAATAGGVYVSHPGVRLTPLHFAAGDGAPAAARLLLELGAAVDAPDVVHGTPLHLAAENARVTTVRVLLEHGADVRARIAGLADDPGSYSRSGRTPLHLVSVRGWEKPGEALAVARLLLEYGAEVNARDGNGYTPLDLVRDPNLRYLLRCAGGRHHVPTLPCEDTHLRLRTEPPTP